MQPPAMITIAHEIIYAVKRISSLSGPPSSMKAFLDGIGLEGRLVLFEAEFGAKPTVPPIGS